MNVIVADSRKDGLSSFGTLLKYLMDAMKTDQALDPNESPSSDAERSSSTGEEARLAELSRVQDRRIQEFIEELAVEDGVEKVLKAYGYDAGKHSQQLVDAIETAKKAAKDSASKNVDFISSFRSGMETEFYQMMSEQAAEREAQIFESVTSSAIAFDNILDPSTAIEEMRAVASQSKRTKEPIRHLIMSLPEGESDIPNKKCIEMARYLVNKIGYEGHQVAYAVHRNTDNTHAHMMICKVNPITKKQPEIDMLIDRCHYASKEAEIEFDLEPDEGNYVVGEDENGNKIVVIGESHVMNSYLVRDENGDFKNVQKGWKEPKEPKERKGTRRKANACEVQNWKQSFDGYLKEHVKSEIFNVIDDKSATWETLHEKLGEYGLTIGPNEKGTGILIKDPRSPSWKCSASNVNKQLSGGKLVKRFGEYEPPAGEYEAKSGLQYDNTQLPERMRNDVASKGRLKLLEGEELTPDQEKAVQQENELTSLLDQYRVERQTYQKTVLKERDRTLKAFWSDARKETAVFHKNWDLVAKGRAGGIQDAGERDLFLATQNLEKQAKLAAIKAENYKQSMELKDEFKKRETQYPSELKYIEALAEKGDETATRALNYARYSRRDLDGSEIRPHHSRSIVKNYHYKSLKGQEENLNEIDAKINIGEDGRRVIQYSRIRDREEERELFADTGTNIKFVENGDDFDKDIEAGLLVAHQKFGGDPMVLTGDSVFKDRALKLAVKHRIVVTNPELQVAYKQLCHERDNWQQVRAEKERARQLEQEREHQRKAQQEFKAEIPTEPQAEPAPDKPDDERTTRIQKDDHGDFEI